MPVTTLKDIIHKGKSFFNCRVEKDMNLQKILEIYACAIMDIEKAIDLNSVKLKDLGIYETCKLKSKNLLSEVLNSLILANGDLQKAMGTLQSDVNNFINTIGQAKDEKVKTNAEDSTAGYLADKITSPQAGCITLQNNQLSFMGFAPIGSVFYIDAGRVSDFDGTGKGRVNTDVWGWAISNGQNGTRNRLGKFVRTVTSNADAGKLAGADEITINPENISSLELPVSGSISDGLVDPKRADVRFNVNKIADGSGGSVILLRFTADDNGAYLMKTLAMDLKHSHAFTLKAAHSNPTPTPISLIPAHILEIPIQRINP